jgi:hypothetical protein
MAKVLLVGVNVSANGRVYGSYITGRPVLPGRKAKGLEFAAVVQSELPVSAFEDVKHVPCVVEVDFEPRQGRDGQYVVVSALRVPAGAAGAQLAAA